MLLDKVVFTRFAYEYLAYDVSSISPPFDERSSLFATFLGSDTMAL